MSHWRGNKTGCFRTSTLAILSVNDYWLIGDLKWGRSPGDCEDKSESCGFHYTFQSAQTPIILNRQEEMLEPLSHFKKMALERIIGWTIIHVKQSKYLRSEGPGDRGAWTVFLTEEKQSLPLLLKTYSKLSTSRTLLGLTPSNISSIPSFWQVKTFIQTNSTRKMCIKIKSMQILL